MGVKGRLFVITHMSDSYVHFCLCGEFFDAIKIGVNLRQKSSFCSQMVNTALGVRGVNAPRHVLANRLDQDNAPSLKEIVKKS